MSYDALRAGRYSSPGQVYMVTTVTHARQALFLDFAVARCVVAELRHAHDTGSVHSLAWVLMPDHLHWLIQLGASHKLADVMKSVKGRSARTIKRLGPYQPTIWQHGYHDHALRSDEDVRGVAEYMANNPLRAGLVSEIGDYSHWDAEWM